MYKNTKQKHNLTTEFDIGHYLKLLEHHHMIFYILADIAHPNFATSVATACVAFNKNTGKIEMLINPVWFGSLNEETQLFVISHEALHILLDHLIRGSEKNKDQENINIAQDIVINELLVREFNYNKQALEKHQFAFVDTIFSEEEIVKNGVTTEQNYEHYYDLLKKRNHQRQKSLECNSHDKGKITETSEHGGHSKPFGEIPEVVVNDVIDALNNKLDNKEKQELLEKIKTNNRTGTQAGSSSLGALITVTLEKVREKKNWESIVKNQIRSIVKPSNEQEETFLIRPRRIQDMPEDMFIPVELDEEHVKKDKYNLKFFLDSSGSCRGLENKFFNIARSLPKDMFKIEAFSFDDLVYTIDLAKPYVRGGGGTRLDIIERRIQNDMKKNNEKYPDLIFIVTDGYGNTVKPKFPKRWFWIVTRDYTEECIPKESTIISINSV